VYGKVLSDTFEPDRVVVGLGSEWLIAQSYFKLHPTGRYVHSAIDALEDLLQGVPGGRLAARDIERIEARTYALAAMLAEKRVVSSFGSRFSVPFALASIIHHGRSGLGSFDDAAVANAEVQALAQRVDLQEDASHTARYPAETPCDVRVVMKNGAVYSGRCTVMKGEPGNPHSRQDLQRKFFELGTAVWGEALTQRLFDGLMTVESIQNFRAFAEDLTL
jgi:2-methylcitrate dehydratase PrpD